MSWPNYGIMPFGLEGLKYLEQKTIVSKTIRLEKKPRLQCLFQSEHAGHLVLPPPTRGKESPYTALNSQTNMGFSIETVMDKTCSRQGIEYIDALGLDNINSVKYLQIIIFPIDAVTYIMQCDLVLDTVSHQIIN